MLYKRDAKQRDVDLLKSAIQRLIDSNEDDVRIEISLFREFGCYFTPGTIGLSARDWLQSIVAILSADER